MVQLKMRVAGKEGVIGRRMEIVGCRIRVLGKKWEGEVGDGLERREGAELPAGTQIKHTALVGRHTVGMK